MVLLEKKQCKNRLVNWNYLSLISYTPTNIWRLVAYYYHNFADLNISGTSSLRKEIKHSQLCFVIKKRCQLTRSTLELAPNETFGDIVRSHHRDFGIHRYIEHVYKVTKWDILTLYFIRPLTTTYEKYFIFEM